MNSAMRLSSAAVAGSGVRREGGGRAWPRMVRAVVAGVLSVLLLGGCLGSGSKPATLSKEQRDQMVQRIQAQVNGLPNLTWATVFYHSPALLDPARFYVSVTVKPGQDFTPIIDAITRIVWTSPLAPLNYVDIHIGHNGVKDTQTVLVNFDGPNADKTLVSKYGARPTATDPS